MTKKNEVIDEIMKTDIQPYHFKSGTIDADNLKIINQGDK